MNERFNAERDKFIAEMDENIRERERWLAANLAGEDVPAWSPPFAKSLGERRILGGDPNRKNTAAGALLDHTMGNMHDALDEQINTERRSLEKTVRQSDPNFYNKLNNCSTGL